MIINACETVIRSSMHSVLICKVAQPVRFVVSRSEQVAQLSQRDRAAGWIINGQKWKTGTGRQYLRTI